MDPGHRGGLLQLLGSEAAARSDDLLAEAQLSPVFPEGVDDAVVRSRRNEEAQCICADVDDPDPHGRIVQNGSVGGRCPRDRSPRGVANASHEVTPRVAPRAPGRFA